MASQIKGERLMAYLEELLPEFRKGTKIRRTGVPQPANAKGYIFYKEGKIYNEFGRECDPDLGFWLSKNDWNFTKSLLTGTISSRTNVFAGSGTMKKKRERDT